MGPGEPLSRHGSISVPPPEAPLRAVEGGQGVEVVIPAHAELNTRPRRALGRANPAGTGRYPYGRRQMTAGVATSSGICPA